MASKKQDVATTTSSKNVSKQPGTAVANIDEDFASELAADSGKGFEETNKDSFAIPFLSILQDLSPQTKKKMPGYIEGAKPGQIFQSVALSLTETTHVIPCHYSQVFIEWTPRNKGGGFVASYDPVVGAAKMKTATKDGDTGRMVLPNGNEIQDTRQHFVLQLNEDGSTLPALMALKSSGLKISRRWMSQMQTAVIEVAGRMVSPPMFAWSYKLSAEEEANDQGSWYQWVIGDRQRVTDIEIYRRAKAFGATMSSGKVNVNYDELNRQADSASQGGRETPADLDNEIDA